MELQLNLNTKAKNWGLENSYRTVFILWDVSMFWGLKMPCEIGDYENK